MILNYARYQKRPKVNLSEFVVRKSNSERKLLLLKIRR